MPLDIGDRVENPYLSLFLSYILVQAEEYGNSYVGILYLPIVLSVVYVRIRQHHGSASSIVWPCG